MVRSAASSGQARTGVRPSRQARRSAPVNLPFGFVIYPVAVVPVMQVSQRLHQIEGPPASSGAGSSATVSLT